MRRPSRPAVFLDRDGVLVVPEFRDGRSYAPTTLDAFEIYTDARESVRALRDAGYLVVVVTNQPDVGRGTISRDVIDAMHERLLTTLQVDHIEMCTHTPDDACECRKPKAGMLLRAAAAMGIRLDGSFMVGDRDSDVLAGKRAGCRTVFIDLGYTAEPKPESADWTVGSLAEATACILRVGTTTGSRHVTAG